MAKYKLTQTDLIFDTEERHWIPNDPTNGHRILYEQWLARGNTPDPADPPPPPPPSRAHPDVPANIVSVAALRDEVANLVAKLKTLGVLT